MAGDMKAKYNRSSKSWEILNENEEVIADGLSKEDANAIESGEMKLTDVNPETAKIKYRLKPDSGKHIMRDGKVVLPGQTIRTDPENLKGAMDKFTVVDNQPELTDAEGPDATLVPRHKGGGYYDVINTVTGLRINQRSLTQEEAKGLLNGDWQEDIEGQDADKADEKRRAVLNRSHVSKVLKKQAEAERSGDGTDMEPAPLPIED